MGLEQNNEIEEQEEVLLYRGFIYELNKAGVFNMTDNVQEKNIAFFKDLLSIEEIKFIEERIERRKIFLKKYKIIASHDIYKFEENLGNYIDMLNKGKYVLNIMFEGENVDRIEIYKKNNIIDNAGESVIGLIESILGNKKTT